MIQRSSYLQPLGSEAGWRASPHPQPPASLAEGGAAHRAHAWAVKLLLNLIENSSCSGLGDRGSQHPAAALGAMIRNWAFTYSPFGLSGADVDWGPGRPQQLGEDVHPHLYFPLEPGWMDLLVGGCLSLRSRMA